MVLYNDRVNAYENARDVDAVIDLQPTKDNIKSLLDNERRNRQAQAELISYSNNGKFLYKHPLLLDRKETNKYIKLMQDDPEEFLKQIHNTKQSISRYSSLINNKKYSDQEQLVRYQELITKHETTLQQMKAAMSKS